MQNWLCLNPGVCVRNGTSLTLPVAGESFTETIFSKAADNNVIGEMDFWCFLVVLTVSEI